MPGLHTLGALAAAFLLTAPAQAQRVRDRVATRSATAGQEMRAGHFEITGGRGCPNNAGVPKITVIQPPAHGVAAVREGAAVPERALLGGEDPLCQGRELRGTHIYYTPAYGYVGDDVLAFQVVFPNGVLNTVMTVHVHN